MIEFFQSDDKASVILLKMGEGFVSICDALASQSFVFVIGMMVGGLIIATGKKELGIKVAHTSLISFIILKVVSGL